MYVYDNNIVRYVFSTVHLQYTYNMMMVIVSEYLVFEINVCDMTLQRFITFSIVRYCVADTRAHIQKEIEHKCQMATG